MPIANTIHKKLDALHRLAGGVDPCMIDLNYFKRIAQFFCVAIRDEPLSGQMSALFWALCASDVLNALKAKYPNAQFDVSLKSPAYLQVIADIHRMTGDPTEHVSATPMYEQDVKYLLGSLSFDFYSSMMSCVLIIQSVTKWRVIDLAKLKCSQVTRQGDVIIIRHPSLPAMCGDR